MRNLIKTKGNPRSKNGVAIYDPIISWVTTVLDILESNNPLSLSDARKNLIPLKDNSYWIWIHRYLEARSSGELYYRLIKFKKNIQQIMNAGRTQAANDDVCISLEKTTPYRGTIQKELPLPSQEEIALDIDLLFSTHLPGLSKQDYVANMGLFLRMLTNGIKTKHQYEMQLAEYLADNRRFQEDFLPGYNSIII